MTRTELLREELEHEGATTRRHLERLPTADFEWRPHEKSFTAGELASHIVDCIRWSESIFGEDETDLDRNLHQPFAADSRDALLEGFDATLARALEAMASTSDGNAGEEWRTDVRRIGPRLEAARGGVQRHDVEPPGSSPRTVLRVPAAPRHRRAGVLWSDCGRGLKLEPGVLVGEPFQGLLSSRSGTGASIAPASPPTSPSTSTRSAPSR